MADFFAALGDQPAAVNVASYTGHGSLREQVLGDDFRRPATEAEAGRMAELLAADMKAGSLGLSTGLEYDPGIYSAPGEVIDLARVAAAHGGRYISHIRSEDRRFWPAIEEIIEIGKQAHLPVQVSHIKLALVSLHGKAEDLLTRLEQARAAGVEITADIYPYTFWESTLTVMFPDRDFDNPEAAAFAVTELSTPEEMLISAFAPDPDVAGKTLAEIAALQGTDAATVLMGLIRQAEAMKAGLPDGERDDVESVIAVSMREDDIERLMTWPHAVFCTDGSLNGTHPRGFGSFPRILGRYVRERQVMGLEKAVHKMTAQTARQLGVPARGLIAPGMAADLVLIDPATILDRATTAAPQAVSLGISAVWVGGQLVFEEGHSTTRRPGIVVRRQPVETGQ
jgi:N-acyl-D-amino-acid deacylase